MNKVNMKKILLILTILAYFAGAGSAIGAELAADAGRDSPETPPSIPPAPPSIPIALSLEQTRLLALANSRSLAKYNLAIKNSELNEQSQFYTNLPTLSLGVSASMTLWNSDGMGETSLADTLTGGANFSVSQKLFNGGKSLVQKAINSIAADMARKDALTDYFAVLYAADTAYYELLQAAAALESAESALQTAELSLSIAEIRSTGGMMKSGDYLQALSEKESKENARNQAKRDLTLKGVKIRNLTGLKETQGEWMAPPVPQPVDFEAYETLIGKLAVLTEGETDALCTNLLKTAAAKNPALAKAVLTKQQAEKNVTLAARDYAPSLSASFSTGLNYSVSNGLEPSTGRLSLSGSIPLDFWVTANNVEKKRIARDQAALDYLGAEENLETDLQTALLDLIAQAGSVLSTRRACEYAEKHFEYVMELFRLSQNSVSTLSDASALVSSNRNQLIRSRYGFLLSLSKIRSLGAFEEESDLTDLLISAGIR
jgi:outer membrane protein TolC